MKKNRIFTAKWRYNLSVSSRKRWDDPKQREHTSEMQTYNWSDPEYRKMMHKSLSRGTTKRWSDPAERERQSQAILSRHVEDPEYSERISETGVRTWSNPKYRKRMKKIRRKQWQDPDNRRAYMSARRKVAEDPALRALFSELLRERWNDPAYRERMASVTRAARLREWSDPEMRKKRREAFDKASAEGKYVLEGKRMWERLSQEERAEWTRRIVQSANVRPNEAEKKLGTILDKLFPGEFKLNVKGDVVIGGKIPDFVNVNGKKIVVELFGNYWHGKRRTGRTRHREEERRRRIFRKWGFEAAIIWEKELKDENRVLNEITRVTEKVAG